MSLQSRITLLAQSIAADIKDLQSGPLVRESVPEGFIKTIPVGYQLQAHGSYKVTGTLRLQGKLVLL